MIDVPRCYFPKVPGRKAAVFSVAVLARVRNGSHATTLEESVLLVSVTPAREQRKVEEEEDNRGRLEEKLE
ncbi:hypothetical protein LINPERHAP1_LOCUS18042 [Linum perenne]